MGRVGAWPPSQMWVNERRSGLKVNVRSVFSFHFTWGFLDWFINYWINRLKRWIIPVNEGLPLFYILYKSNKITVYWLILRIKYILIFLANFTLGSYFYSQKSQFLSRSNTKSNKEQSKKLNLLKKIAYLKNELTLI